MKRSPIVFLDDDPDDLDTLKQAISDIGIKRPTKFFTDGAKMIAFIQQLEEPPFLILSDLNMPGQNGFQIRRQILDNSQLIFKNIPFVFWTTSSSEQHIQYAFDLHAQGYFVKPTDYDKLCNLLKSIFDYWEQSTHTEFGAALYRHNKKNNEQKSGDSDR